MSKVLSTLLFVFIGHLLIAQSTSTGAVSIGVNPTYSLFGGYGVKAFYDFPKKWSVGLLSEGAFDLPEFGEKQFFDQAEAINVHWDYSLGIELTYRFTKKDNSTEGFYGFGTFGYENWTIERADDAIEAPGTPQEDQFDNWFASVGVGYNWFPFDNNGFWIGGAYNLIFILNNNTDRSLNGDEYRLKPIVPPSLLPNIYVGWQF